MKIRSIKEVLYRRDMFLKKLGFEGLLRDIEISNDVVKVTIEQGITEGVKD